MTRSIIGLFVRNRISVHLDYSELRGISLVFCVRPREQFDVLFNHVQWPENGVVSRANDLSTMGIARLLHAVHNGWRPLNAQVVVHFLLRDLSLLSLDFN